MRLRRDGAGAGVPVRVGLPGAAAATAPDRPAHILPHAEFVAELRRLHGTPEAVLTNDEMLNLLMPTLRADFAVLETYRPCDDGPLACPIIAAGGREDEQVSPDDLAAWGRQTTGRFELHLFAGGHFFLRTAGADLLRFLAAALHELMNDE